MRIHLVASVFSPEPVASARMAAEVAGELAGRRHEVTVFASFPNRPSGELQPNYRRSWRLVERRDGYRVVRSWHTLSKRSTLLSRLAENISFGMTSTLAMMREPVPDVAYVGNWPIFAMWMNSAALYRRRVPMIGIIKDLYPETLLEAKGVSQAHPLFRLLRHLDRRAYRRSTLITVINSAQRDHLIADRGVPPDKVEIFEDWVDASEFSENKARNGSFRLNHGLSPELFLAMYVGSLTRMAGLDLYVEAAGKLRHRKDIRLLMVGDGAMRREVESAIRERRLENLEVIYPLTPEEVPEVQAAADVLLLSLLPGAAATATPSKLVSYLFSGRPVLANVEEGGPSAGIIGEARCGYITSPGDAGQFADQLMSMADEQGSLAELGRNARRYAEDHFSRASVLPRVCDAIERIASN